MSLSPEERCPLSGGDGYKDYVNSFPGPNFVPLNRCVPLERFHCSILYFVQVSPKTPLISLGMTVVKG